MWNGRCFQPRQTPDPENRKGRFTTGDAPIVIGAGCIANPTGGPDNTGQDGFERTVVQVADGEQPPSTNGGLLYWEAEYDGMRGRDPVLTNPVDIDAAPADTPVQVWNDRKVKVLFCNVDATEVGPVGVGMSHSYAARNMIDPAALGATPTAVQGAFLTPQDNPNDTNGYWQVTATKANAWWEINWVDADNGRLEATWVG